MVQSMVESGMTEVPLEFVKPQQERVSSTRSQNKSEGARAVKGFGNWETGALMNNLRASREPQIPVIDLAMLDDGKKQLLLAETARACEEWGCFQLINHGVPDALMDVAMDSSKRFFALPAVEKEEFRMKTVGGMGYGRYFERPGVAKDWIDRLVLNDFTKEDSAESIGSGACFDLVLTKPAGAQEVLESYGKALHELGRKMMAVFSEALGQTPEFLLSKLLAKNSTVLNYYPPCPQPDLMLGLSAHEDGGVFTFLQQGDVAGLEVLSKDERWVPVTPVAHAFIVVIADVLQVVSNDMFKSVSHRAVAGPLGRFVIANFIVPDGNSLVQPAPELCSESNPPVYKSMPVAEYIKLVFVNDLHLKRLETVKLVPVLQR